MNSFIGIRRDHDDEDRAPRSSAVIGGAGAVEYDEMDAAIHNDEEAAAEFLERLGDLDQFVAGAAGTVSFAVGTGTVAGLRNHPQVTAGFDRDGEFVVLDPSVAGDRHAAPEPAPDPTLTPAPFDDDADTRAEFDEAQEFLDRLGDLDRFIATVPDDEVADFHQRLSDLDRFVGGPGATAAQAALCAACRKPVSPTDMSTVHAVHLLGAIEGRAIEGLPRQFHETCWIDGDGAYRRTR